MVFNEMLSDPSSCTVEFRGAMRTVTDHDDLVLTELVEDVCKRGVVNGREFSDVDAKEVLDWWNHLEGFEEGSTSSHVMKY